MTPDQLLVEVASLIEAVCRPTYDRTSGDEQPITNQQFDVLADRFLMLCDKNRTQEESRERTSARV